MISPGTGLNKLLDDYERVLRSERALVLQSEETREAAEKEIELLLVQKQMELELSDPNGTFPASW